MSHGSPIEKSLQEICENLAFFKQSKILSFEEAKMFHCPKIQIFRPDMQLKNKSAYKYDNQHPKFRGIANATISNLFRKTKQVSINDLNLFDLPVNKNQSFFISFTYNKQNGWLLDSGTNAFIFYDDSKQVHELNNPKISFFDNKYLKLSTSNINYPLKIHSIGVQSQIKEIERLGEFIDHVNSSQTFVPFENLIQSFQKCGSYPSVSLETQNFYSSIVEDPQFLFLISNLSGMQKEVKNNYVAWLQSSGLYLRSLFPLIAFSYFKTITSDSELFQNNNFLSKFSASVYKNDSEFSLFCESFDPPTEKVVEYFLIKLSTLHLGNLAKFVTIILYEESKRVLHDGMGPILVLSRIIFQNAFASLLLHRNSDYLPIVDQILTFCSFTSGDHQMHNYLKNQIQRIIQESINERQSIYFNKSGFTPLSHIHTLIKISFTHSDEFLDALHKYDFQKNMIEFKQSKI